MIRDGADDPAIELPVDEPREPRQDQPLRKAPDLAYARQRDPRSVVGHLEADRDLDNPARHLAVTRGGNVYCTVPKLSSVFLLSPQGKPRQVATGLDQPTGLVLTSDMWMGPKVDAMKEIVDFDLRYAKQVGGPMVAGASPEQMAAAMAMKTKP